MGALLLAIVLTAAGPQMEVQTLDGRTVVGAVAELGDSRATIEAGGSRTPLGVERATGLAYKNRSKPAAEEPKVWVELIDGSALVGQNYTARGAKGRITLPGGPLEVRTQDIAFVRLQAPGGPVEAEWTRVLQARRSGDLLVSRKGDVIDYHEGALRNVTDDVVEFDLDGEVVPVQRAKVYGLVYHHRIQRDLPAAICRLADVTGAQWSVRSLELAGDLLRWSTPAGVELSRPAADVQIDFCHYLSDLKPESTKWTPFFGTEKELKALAELYAPRRDQNLESKPLQVGGKQYPKGLAMHSRTDMVYRLPGKFSRFKAVAGIDDGVRPHGNVRLVIRGDDKVLLDTTVAGSDPPKPIDLDISGVRRLAILVDFGADLDVADHLDLCSARIFK